MSIVDEFTTGFSHPHDFAWSPNQKELLIAHYGKKLDFEPTEISAPVVRLDYASKKILAVHKSHLTSHRLCHIVATEGNSFMVGASRLIEKTGPEFDSLRRIQSRHKEHRKKGFVKAKSTKALPSPSVFIDEKGKTHEIWTQNHDRMKSNVSLTYSKTTGVTLIAHSGGAAVSFWKGTQSVAEFSIENDVPIGVAPSLDGKFFYLTTNKNAIYVFDAKSGAHLNTINCKERLGEGSLHAYCIPKA